MSRADAMIEAAPRLPDGTAVVTEVLDGDAALVRDVASRLIRRDGVIALLGGRTGGEDVALVFARSANVDRHMGQLLGVAAKPLGGKGGGRADFAQGGGPAAIIDAAKALLTE